MKTLIEGGWVVAWNGTTSRGVRARRASCSRTTASSTPAGPTRAPVDARLSARGKLVSPGFINTHVHTTGNGGDYLLARHGQERLPHVQLHELRRAAQGQDDAAARPRPWPRCARTCSCTRSRTARPPSSTWAACAATGRATRGSSTTSACACTASPPFRDRNTFMDAQGRLYYEHDAAAGAARLKEAVAFVKAYDGAAQGRLRGMLNAAQVETCSEPLLRAGKDAARELGRAHPHARRRQPGRVPARSWTSTGRRRSSSSPTSASSTTAP